LLDQLNQLVAHLHEIAWQFGPRGLNGECCGDLSMPEFRALKMVDANSACAVQDIGFALDFTKSGATRVIDRLEKKGYVLRERSENDGRIVYVKITPKGKDVLKRIDEEFRQKLQQLIAEMDPIVANALPNVLSHLVKTLRREFFIANG